MTIDKIDIKSIQELIAWHLPFADTVMVPQYGKISKDNLHFCSGPEDWQEFMYTEPDAHTYEAVDPRELHDVLLAINEQKTPARDLMHNGFAVKGMVDIGSMLDDRAIIRDLHAIMPKINAEFMSSQEPLSEKAKVLLKEIGYNLQKLCKDEHGLSTANELWDRYMTGSPVKKPDLFRLPGDQWFVESLRQFEGVLELRIPALFDRTIKDLAKGDSPTIHLNAKNGAMPVAIYAEPFTRTLMAYLKTSVAKDNKISVSPHSKDRAIPLDQFIKIVSKHEDLTRGPRRPPGDSGDDPDENNLSRGRKR